MFNKIPNLKVPFCLKDFNFKPWQFYHQCEIGAVGKGEHQQGKRFTNSLPARDWANLTLDKWKSANSQIVGVKQRDGDIDSATLDTALL